MSNSAPSPPSSQIRSFENLHSLVHAGGRGGGGGVAGGGEVGGGEVGGGDGCGGEGGGGESEGDGGEGGVALSPQSPQSDPRSQSSYSAPGPPSSQLPSFA